MCGHLFPRVGQIMNGVALCVRCQHPIEAHIPASDVTPEEPYRVALAKIARPK